MMGMTCPICGSASIQPFAVIHENGTQHFNATHTAMTSDGHFVQGTSHGTQATILAQRCAPPVPPSPMPFIGAYGIGAFLVYTALTVCPVWLNKCVYVGLSALRYTWKEAAVGLCIVGLGWFLMKGWHALAKEYNVAKRRWQNTWFCHSCGQSHVVQ